MYFVYNLKVTLETWTVTPKNKQHTPEQSVETLIINPLGTWFRDHSASQPSVV